MITIHRMTSEDVPQVAELERRCFSEPWSEATFADYCSREDICYLVLKEENKVIGNCGVRNIAGEGEITNVAIDEAYRGKGLSVKLMEELLKKGTEMGITEFTLEVRAGNAPAIHLYEKMGFLTEGVRKGFYEHPKEDALIMWKR